MIFEAALPRRRGRSRSRRLFIPAAVALAFAPLGSSQAGRMVLAPSLQLADAGDGDWAPLDPRFEKLLRMTAETAPLPALTAPDAIERNANLPFARTPLQAAAVFTLPDPAGRSAMTALHCLTLAIYYEAGFEPEQGRRAVAQVVLNRMRHPAFPKSVCGVVYQGSNQRVCQFSFTCDGSLNRPPQAAAWAAAQRLAREALAGYVEASVGYATNYHANYVSPYWAPRLTKLVQIGAHIFYRWPGSWGLPGAFSGRYSGSEFVPRLVARGNAREADADEQTRALAEARLSPDLVPSRHAENDVGGRVDVSKGWALSIPDPEEVQSAASEIAARQRGS